MKAVIEIKENNLYLIRIYGSDGIPCDAYVVDKIEIKHDIENLLKPC